MHEFVAPDLSLLSTAVVSVGADLDFVAGPADSDANKYHGRALHSITAAVTMGMLGALRAGRGSRMRSMVGVACIYGSHLLLAAMGKEPIDGIALLWSFSQRPFAFRGPSFRTIYRNPDEAFIRCLIHRGNRKAVIRVLKITLPFYGIVRDLARK